MAWIPSSLLHSNKDFQYSPKMRLVVDMSLAPSVVLKLQYTLRIWTPRAIPTTIKNTMQDYDVFVPRKDCDSTKKNGRAAHGLFSVSRLHLKHGSCSASVHINTCLFFSSSSPLHSNRYPSFSKKQLFTSLCVAGALWPPQNYVNMKL